MKVQAAQLQNIAKVLGTVKAEQFLFAGQNAYSIGQNIQVIVLLPNELGTFGVSADRFKQLVDRLAGEVEIYLEE